MAKNLKCADLGGDCPGSFTTETEEELFKHVELHAGEAHPDMEMTPEVMEQAKAIVRDV